jgi:hypothetical protein
MEWRFIEDDIVEERVKAADTQFGHCVGMCNLRQEAPMVCSVSSYRQGNLVFEAVLASHVGKTLDEPRQLLDADPACEVLRRLRVDQNAGRIESERDQHPRKLVGSNLHAAAISLDVKRIRPGLTFSATVLPRQTENAPRASEHLTGATAF